ncbi:MAG: hypothetical protein JRH15_00960 [Deltaproteobacteria bacterium]|nr:hypothetical protein [Deltaproteobacteria bacterium]
MKLPPKNTEVSLPEIKKVCDHFGLTALWAKIDQDPPQKPFKSDGCSMWFDTWEEVDLSAACFLHDLKYWAGYPGEDTDRLIADAELMIDVARAGAPKMAEIMFAGVRVGGHERFNRSFSWGSGRSEIVPIQNW